MSYTLSPDQANALREIGAWYRSKSSPYLTLGGYAGTGKTSLIAYLRKALSDYDEGARVAFCAYTGKATRVLAQKIRAIRALGKGAGVTPTISLINTKEPDGMTGPKG